LNHQSDFGYTPFMVTNFETKLLDDLLDPVTRCLTPEAAARLVGLRADDAAQRRMDELAEKSGDGTLSEDERAEYAAYISAANLLAILQAKARRLVAGGTAA
jgi:hypothetical protein